MLNKLALANSIVALVIIFYAAFYLLSLAAPSVFEFLFNAQFLGADVALLLPESQTAGELLGTLAALAATSWISGYLWGWLYNFFVK